jgi:hypothetical protein
VEQDLAGAISGPEGSASVGTWAKARVFLRPKPVLLMIQIFARRDDFGQKGQQGLKPLIPAMLVGTSEVVP